MLLRIRVYVSFYIPLLPREVRDRDKLVRTHIYNTRIRSLRNFYLSSANRALLHLLSGKNTPGEIGAINSPRELLFAASIVLRQSTRVSRDSS